MLSTRLFWILILIAVAISGLRVLGGQVDLQGIGQEEEYAFDLTVDVGAAAGDFDLEIFVPRSGVALKVRDEQLGAEDLELRVTDQPEGRRLVATGSRDLLPTKIRYQARLAIRPRVYRLPARIEASAANVRIQSALDSTRFVPTGHAELNRELTRLFPELDRAGEPWPTTNEGWIRRHADSGLDVLAAVDRIHLYCLDGLRSANFSGATDAITALRLGEASCGGKSRLMVGLLRTMGIPARMRGGLILGDTTRKRTSHVWVEVALGDQWVPYDPLNGYRAELPSHYLALYEGDLPLIQYTRGLAFDYGFRAPLERVPKVWTLSADDRASIGGPSFLGRDQFSLILLAPFALLLTVFVRQVVGLESIGVFLPVLLGFCVTQVGWGLSGLLLAGTLVFGVLVRLALTKINLLHVPRAALMISFLVLLFLVLTLSLDRLGITAPRGILVLPLAALAMAVEKFTVVALDRGPVDALKLLAQTILLAIGCALILMQPIFKLLTVALPEVLLIVLAEIVILGQYRGMRWTEWRRFRHVKVSP